MTRSASAISVLALAFLYAAPAAAASSWPPGGRMDINSGTVAYLIEGGQLTQGTTQAQPPELKMRTFTLRRQGGYVATFTFAAAFQQPTSNLSGAVDYAVLLKLMPPGRSPIFTGLLTSVDHRALSVALGTPPSAAPAGTVAIAGSTVAYRLPAALGVGPDWDVQAGVYWLEASGSGYYSLMLAANVAGLSAEAPRGAVTYARGAIPISRGQVDLTRLVSTPPGAHLDQLRLVQSAGRVSAVASFDGPVAKLATINGQPTSQQLVNLALLPDPLDPSHQYAFFYDVLKATLTGQEFKGSNVTTLPPIKVTVSGRDVSFDLGPAPTSDTGSPAAGLLTTAFAADGAPLTNDTSMLASTTTIDASENGFGQYGQHTQAYAMLHPTVVAPPGATAGFPWWLGGLALVVMAFVVAVVVFLVRRPPPVSIQAGQVVAKDVRIHGIGERVK